MYGPAVRFKKISSNWRLAVLHQCIRPLIGACCAPGHHGYQRACVLINGQASIGPFGHQCSHALGRPILHSSCPLADLGWKLLIGYVIACSSYRAVPLFEPRTVPSSRPAQRRSRRAQGRSRPAAALGLRLAPASPGCALTAPSTAR